MTVLKYLFAISLSMIILFAGTMLMNIMIIPHTAYTDSLPVHSGCTAFFDGTSPYDDSVTLRTQQTIREEYDPSYYPSDPHRFAYPVHTCLLLFPLWTVSYDTMAPAWMFLNFMLFTLMPILFMLKVARYHVKLWQGLLLTVLSLFFWRYSIISVIFAQYVGWVLLCLVFAIWATMNRRETLLAIFLVGLTIRPGGAFFAILLLSYALYERRYRTILIFIAIMLVLWLITLIMVGPWIMDFLSGIFAYTGYRQDVRWLPLRMGIAPGLSFLFIICIAGISVVYRAWQKGRETFVLWGMTTLALVELILLPQTNAYTLIYVLPSIMLVAYAFRGNVWQFLLSVLFMGSLPWIWFYLGDNNILTPNWDQLFMPGTIMLAVVFAWWLGDVVISKQILSNSD